MKTLVQGETTRRSDSSAFNRGSGEGKERCVRRGEAGVLVDSSGPRDGGAGRVMKGDG